MNMENTYPVNQKLIFSNTLKEAKKLNFSKRVKVNEPGQVKVTRDQYLIITIEEFIKQLKLQGNKLIFKNENLKIYNTVYWEDVDEGSIRRVLGMISSKFGVPKFKGKHYSFRDDLLKQLKSTIISPNFPIQKPILINVLNGTIQFSGEKIMMQNFNLNNFMTYQLSFGFDHTAEAPMFHKYLDEVLPDKNAQSVLAEYIGSIFIKSGSGIKLEKALILVGGGSNGKSVFFEIISALLGAQNISYYSLSSLTDNTGYSRAQIENKLLNFASEIDKKMDVSKFKQLVSNEPIEARNPYGRAHQIRNYAKLAFNTNSLPTDVESTKAFFRRFIIIPFDVTISEEDQDKELHTKIISNELSGVFNWVLKGLIRVIKQKGFSQSNLIDKQVKLYEKESDTVKMFMDEYGYKKSTKCNYKVSELFDVYKIFCNQDGYRPVNNKEFCKTLENMGFHFVRKNYGKAVNVTS